MGMRLHRHDPAVVRITTAPESTAADISHRQRRYVISMAIRTLCFIGAIVAGPGWFRWVLVAGALFLPYVAVVMANAASPRVEGTQLQDGAAQHPELAAGQHDDEDPL